MGASIYTCGPQEQSDEYAYAKFFQATDWHFI